MFIKKYEIHYDPEVGRTTINSNKNNTMEKNLLLIISIAIIFTSCKNNVPTINYAHGLPGEIVVVMSNERWNSESGNILKAVLATESETLPMEEPLFALHQIEKSEFNQINMLHRNIIFQEINSNIEQSYIKLIKDKYAKNQSFIHIIAKNQTEFVKIVLEHKDELIDIFLTNERNQFLKQFEKYNNKPAAKKLSARYSINMIIPQNFTLDVENENFAWLSKETKKYTMNILVYTYPLTDSTELTAQYLIEKRNEVVKENIPGENDGSYMTTETKYNYPTFTLSKHKKLDTGILQGLWKVHGDFMGGGFVSYSKIDRPRNRVVTVEGFVYYPNHEMRDLIRELDAILYTFDFVF
ncbi:MAG: DUF4837 family protein [Bacteroidales bacterium]|jgi:hypothetical protein|nr:DUF4837 family protein [Bacteroidales bacterium]